VGEDAAAEVGAEVVLDPLWDAIAIGVGRCGVGKEGLEVVLDERVERRGSGVAPAIDGGESVGPRAGSDRGGARELRFAAAAANLRKAYDIDPTFVKAAQFAAISLAWGGDAAAAESLATAAMAANQPLPDYERYSGQWILASLRGRREEAYRNARETARVSSHPLLRGILAWDAPRHGLAEEAVRPVVEPTPRAWMIPEGEPAPAPMLLQVATKHELVATYDPAVDLPGDGKVYRTTSCRRAPRAWASSSSGQNSAIRVSRRCRRGGCATQR
jgi:hypothetical protein